MDLKGTMTFMKAGSEKQSFLRKRKEEEGLVFPRSREEDTDEATLGS